jgi:hypothetical protein
MARSGNASAPPGTLPGAWRVYDPVSTDEPGDGATMSASDRLLGEIDDRAGAAGRHRVPDRPTGAGHAPALTGAADPRLAHAPSAATGLMALQRSAGNAAVSSLVGAAPVQRVVAIDELTTEVATAPEEGPAPDGGNPVSSSGGTTTISGSQINLEAAMTSTSGIIRAGTIVADSVVASSYTPGAGNVW